RIAAAYRQRSETCELPKRAPSLALPLRSGGKSTMRRRRGMGGLRMTGVDDGGVVVSPRQAGRAWQSSSGLTAILLVGVVILSIGPSVSTPFTWTDSPALANVGSSSWVDRAFAFNDDRPGPKSPNLGAWWDGMTLQHRFIRIPPSLFMTAEVALLGQRAV